MVASDCAVGNRHRSVVRYAAAGTGREVGTSHTGVVIAHDAIGHYQCTVLAVDAAALATTEGKVVVSRPVAVDRAIHDRHCAVLVVDAAPRIGRAIQTDNAIEDCQCRAAV